MDGAGKVRYETDESEGRAQDLTPLPEQHGAAGYPVNNEELAWLEICEE